MTLVDSKYMGDISDIGERQIYGGISDIGRKQIYGGYQ